jgi:hypothetical protein
MRKFFTPPTTLNQAFNVARIVLTNARDLHLEAVSNDNYATEADKLQQLVRLGSITAAYYELDALGPAVDELRRGLLRMKPTPPTYQAVLTELDEDIPTLSTVGHEIVAMLPELAQLCADVQHNKDERKKAIRHTLTGWHPLTQEEKATLVEEGPAYVVAATAMLQRLPAQLRRVREVAEAGTAPNFRTASTWLK